MTGQGTDRIVLDSSVVVKWFISEQEADVPEALAFLSEHSAGTTIIAAPDHVLLEVLSALRKRGFTGADLEAAAQALVSARLELHGVDSRAVECARLSAQHDLTPYDAAFAALANALDAELVTADRTLAGSGACRSRLLGETISLD